MLGRLVIFSAAWKDNGQSCLGDQECVSGYCDARNMHALPWRCATRQYTGICDDR